MPTYPPGDVKLFNNMTENAGGGVVVSLRDVGDGES